MKISTKLILPLLFFLAHFISQVVKHLRQIFRMKKTLSIFIFILPLLINSQNKETIDWITNNSIEIQDANPNSELKNFENNTSLSFFRNPNNEDSLKKVICKS